MGRNKMNMVLELRSEMYVEGGPDSQKAEEGGGFETTRKNYK